MWVKSISPETPTELSHSELWKTFHQNDLKWALIHRSSRPAHSVLFFFISPLDVGSQSTALCSVSVNQWVPCGRKKDHMGCRWGAAGRCHCLWKERWMENRRASGSWERVRRNNRESITGKYPVHFVCTRFFFPPAFLFHSPHGWSAHRLWCFYLQASGAAPCCHKSLWLDVFEECLCVALHVHYRTLPCLWHSMKLCPVSRHQDRPVAWAV